MNALNAPPPFPLNPAVGERYGQYVWNGATWVCAPATGVQVLVTVFTASGPYMPSPGLVSVTVECWGGGGSGGGATNSNASVIMSGAGGGSGGYSRKTLPAALVLGGVQITIGQGGTPHPASQEGGNGTATSFGALCVANGGLGGFGADGVTQAGQSGVGAAPGVGDFTPPGNSGLCGIFQTLAASTFIVAQPGMGGAIEGGAFIYDVAPGSAIAGAAGRGTTGAGGAGGCLNQASGGVNGGAGAPGMCVVTEYCWATGDGDCVNPPLNVNARVAVTHVPWQGPGPCPPGWGSHGEIGYDGDG